MTKLEKAIQKPELLIPAGNLEKLKIAFAYGADACFIGCSVFGLRKFADNFSNDEMKEAIALANQLGKKVYLVLNGFAHNEDLEDLTPFLDTVEKLHPHALIISDLGVLQLAREKTTIPLHASTQASITNAYTCKLWADAGASRIILAREVTLTECAEILKLIDIELEVFVHGAMCASYSGKCVISNYMSGRDSNRGGCVQSCRHTYDLFDTENPEETPEDTTHIMNAKDLMAVSLLPELIKTGIASLKIEGRMKSNMYAASCASVYRDAIDQCYEDMLADRPFDAKPFEARLEQVSNRNFSTGGLDHRPFGDSIHYPTSMPVKSVDFIGTIKAILPNQALFVDVKMPFQVGDTLERMTPDGQLHPLTVTEISDMNGHSLKKCTPNSIVQLPWINNARELDILRKQV